MNRLSVVAPLPLVILGLGIALPSGDAMGQQRPLNEQITGAWTYVSVDTVRPNGERVPMYGPNPQGLVIFDGRGHYALVNARADLPKIVSNNRMEGTPDEYKAVAQGAIAHFGTYTINQTDKTITFQIQTSTYPNWNGTVQKRPFTLIGDELRWTTPAASGGGSGEVVLRRAK